MKNKLQVIPLLIIIIGIIISFCLLRYYKLDCHYGDAATFWGTVATIYGGFLLYQQINDQRINYKLDKYMDSINNLHVLLNSIHYKTYVGSRAIVEYGLNFKTETQMHPRTVLDQTIYLVEVINNLIFQLKKESNYLGKEVTQELITDILFFYYFNLYYSLVFGRIEPVECGLYGKIEVDKYKTFKNKIDDLNYLSYIYLSHNGKIDKHDESEEKYNSPNFNNPKFNDLKKLLS